MELAEHYVSDLKEGLTEVAFRLGFSEQSSFSRAFKRWAGMSPSEYRAEIKKQTIKSHGGFKGHSQVSIKIEILVLWARSEMIGSAVDQICL